jgi:UDP-4-amino-4,6-dideoxy-N-acetyl-beta-L-altrosamine N-acetyltransferase
MLRPATDDDLGNMLRWRNHPQMRAASFTSHEIGWEEHVAWWARTRGDKTRSVLIYERAGVPCGVVTFHDIDRRARTADWSFYVDNEGLAESGELLGAWVGLEREALDHAFDVLGIVRLGGHTLASNQVVLQLHRRFGFHEVSTEQRVIDGVLQDVVRTELRAEDRPARR